MLNALERCIECRDGVMNRSVRANYSAGKLIHVLALLAAPPLVFLAAACRPQNTQRPSVSTAPPSAPKVFRLSAKQGSSLRSSLSRLSSGEEGERAAAKKELIALANVAVPQRRAVTQAVLDTVDTHDMREKLLDPRFSRLWVGSFEVLSELRAPEATELFIRCIDCLAITEHVSDTYHHLPAVRALIRMGDVVVPRLSEALKAQEPGARMYASLCLGSIGGRAARGALAGALDGETDSSVRQQMEESIATIDRDMRW